MVCFGLLRRTETSLTTAKQLMLRSRTVRAAIGAVIAPMVTMVIVAIALVVIAGGPDIAFELGI